MAHEREGVSESELDHLLDVARLDADRLALQERTLAYAGVVGLVLTAIGARSTLVLALAITASLGSIVASLFVRRRLERRQRGVLAMELARDAFEDEASVVHPYRTLVVSPEEKPKPPPRRGQPIANVIAIAALAASVVAILASFGRLGPKHQHWSFLDAVDTPTLLGLHPSPLHAGEWRVEEHDGATGARALVNDEGEPLAPPATIVARSAWMRDFAASTRCKTDPSRPVQQCGIVYRFRDEAHYDLVRLDTQRKEIVLALVEGAEERVIARAPADAPSGAWHELSVDVTGPVVRVSWNGRKAIEMAETLPSASGAVGLWAPASGVSWFDELAIEGRVDSPRPLETVPLLGRSRS